MRIHIEYQDEYECKHSEYEHSHLTVMRKRFGSRGIK